MDIVRIAGFFGEALRSNPAISKKLKEENNEMLKANGRFRILGNDYLKPFPS